MTAEPDIIVADEIRARLPDNIFARNLVVLAETQSTNDIALKAGRDGKPEGFAVLAERQTHGRGTKSRSWHAVDKKGLCLSLLFRPPWPAEHAFRLTCLSSAAVCRSITGLTKISCGIKWPNDVMVANRKLAGILTETRTAGPKIEFAVVGIGCNLKQTAADFSPELQGRATSLLMQGAAPELRRSDFLVRLLQELAGLYQQPPAALFAEWRDLCLNIGQKIQVRTENSLVEGVLTGLGENGHLQILQTDGKIEVLNSGEILF